MEQIVFNSHCAPLGPPFEYGVSSSCFLLLSKLANYFQIDPSLHIRVIVPWCLFSRGLASVFVSSSSVFFVVFQPAYVVVSKFNSHFYPYLWSPTSSFSVTQRLLHHRWAFFLHIISSTRGWADGLDHTTTPTRTRTVDTAVQHTLNRGILTINPLPLFLSTTSPFHLTFFLHSTPKSSAHKPANVTSAYDIRHLFWFRVVSYRPFQRLCWTQAILVSLSCITKDKVLLLVGKGFVATTSRPQLSQSRSLHYY